MPISTLDGMEVEEEVQGYIPIELVYEAAEPELLPDNKTVRVGDSLIQAPQVGSKTVGQVSEEEQARREAKKKAGTYKKPGHAGSMPGKHTKIKEIFQDGLKYGTDEYDLGWAGKYLFGITQQDVKNYEINQRTIELGKDHNHERKRLGLPEVQWDATKESVKEDFDREYERRRLVKEDPGRYRTEVMLAQDKDKVQQQAEVTQKNDVRRTAYVDLENAKQNRRTHNLAVKKGEIQNQQWEANHEYIKANDLRNRADIKDSNALQIQLKQMEIDDSQQRYERDMEFYRAEKLQQELSNSLGYLMMLFN